MKKTKNPFSSRADETFSVSHADNVGGIKPFLWKNKKNNPSLRTEANP
jgi:hypothetical protein